MSGNLKPNFFLMPSPQKNTQLSHKTPPDRVATKTIGKKRFDPKYEDPGDTKTTYFSTRHQN